MREEISSRIKMLRLRANELRIEARTAAARCRGFEEAITLLAADASSQFARKKLEDRLRKEKNTAELCEADLTDVEGKLSAFEETLKLLPKDGEDAANVEFRPGTAVAKCRELLRSFRREMTISELLVGIGHEDTPEARSNLRGSIGKMAREGNVFVKTAPSTFGLIELGHQQNESTEE